MNDFGQVDRSIRLDSEYIIVGLIPVQLDHRNRQIERDHSQAPVAAEPDGGGDLPAYQHGATGFGDFESYPNRTALLDLIEFQSQEAGEGHPPSRPRNIQQIGYLDGERVLRR